MGASSFLLLQLICVCDNLSVPNANGASKDRSADSSVDDTDSCEQDTASSTGASTASKG